MQVITSKMFCPDREGVESSSCSKIYQRRCLMEFEVSTRFEMVKMKDTGLRRIISHVSTKGKHHIMATLMMYVNT